jgi:2'-5' RNA ligase
MRVGLALLADRVVANAVNRLAWAVHMRWHNGIAARAYPAHISLKQPFEIGDDLDAILAYSAVFAASLPPLSIALKSLYVWDTVLGIDVVEDPLLRGLHNRLNAELPPIFGDVRADYDGDEYHFHMTIALGGANAATYQSILAACANEMLPHAFTATELGLFTGYQRPAGDWQFMLHTAFPLNKPFNDDPNGF